MILKRHYLSHVNGLRGLGAKTNAKAAFKTFTSARAPEQKPKKQQMIANPNRACAQVY